MNGDFESPRRLAMVPLVIATAGIIASFAMAIVPALRADASVTYTKAVTLTFYGWPDNDPAHSAAIAHPGCKGSPRVCHSVAAGTGTWANPITVAAIRGNITVGARIWLPRLRAYLIVEDDCSDCRPTPWLDVWINGRGHPDASVLACEDALTPDGRISAEFNPPSTHTPRTVPLYDGVCHP